MPLSRRRAFEGKLYERETGGTANVFLASEELHGERVGQRRVQLRRKMWQPRRAPQEQPVQPPHRHRTLLPHAVVLAQRLPQLFRNLAQLATHLL